MSGLEALTRYQLGIARDIAAGMSLRAIADDRGCARPTIRVQAHRMYRKFGLPGLRELRARLVELGLEGGASRKDDPQGSEAELQAERVGADE